MIIEIDTDNPSDVEQALDILQNLREERFGKKPLVIQAGRIEEQVIDLAKDIERWLLEHAIADQQYTVEKAYVAALQLKWEVLEPNVRKAIGRVFARLSRNAVANANVGQSVLKRVGRTLQNAALYSVQVTQ